MATPTASNKTGARGERAPAQLFALVAGATLVLVGAIGFAVDSSTAARSSSSR